MENTDNNLTRLLLSLSNEDYCYLTTKGRVSGRPHEIEIWFGVHGNALYLFYFSKYQIRPLPVDIITYHKAIWADLLPEEDAT